MYKYTQTHRTATTINNHNIIIEEYSTDFNVNLGPSQKCNLYL